MQKDNAVIFKGRKDGIIIYLDENSDFDTIKEAMAAKAAVARGFFGKSETSISYKGRNLSEEEEKELTEIIKAETNLKITFTDSGMIAFPGPEAKAAGRNRTSAPPMINESDNMTHFRVGGLRSGQLIRHSGSVVLLGDVNPGAEIVAEGNIVVMGTVKGLVHAGSTGNTNCFVSCLSLQPTQLRIADKIVYFTPEMIKENKNNLKLVHAYIKDGQICIEPLGNGEH